MFDGNGNWTSDFSAQADRDNGIKILASRFDNIFIADLKESFENCLTKDGQIAPIGAFNMGGQKITNIGTGSNDTDGVNFGQMNSAITTASDNLFSIGDIKTSVRDANHGNWFLCDGQAIDRQIYANLYAIIGTNFGVGDGVTTFNLPDYRGKFLRGLGGNSAADIYTTQAEGLPNITGNVDFTRCQINSATGVFRLTESRTAIGANSNVPTGLISFDASRSSSVYGNSAHVTPINQAINYFIKVL